jgi:[acyl-carrier-protein] S-malonyltransferase
MAVSASESSVRLRAGGYALLFPGQGGQFPGMAWGWHRRSRRVRSLFARAERVTGMPLRRLCFEGTREELSSTEVTQPCVFLVGLAGAAVLEEELEEGGAAGPRFVAGHSLGQFTALAAAGALDLESALELVCVRAQLMAAAAGGGMAAVLGLAPPRVGELCAAIAGEDVVVAAVNGPTHTVVSGERAALGRVAAAAGEAGATRVIELPISVAAHSPQMAGAEAAFAARVAELDLNEPAVPIVLNGDSRPTRSAACIRAELASHMCACVQWWSSLRAMLGAGVELLLEVGPGRSLARELDQWLAPASVVCLGRERALPAAEESA